MKNPASGQQTNEKKQKKAARVSPGRFVSLVDSSKGPIFRVVVKRVIGKDHVLRHLFLIDSHNHSLHGRVNLFILPPQIDGDKNLINTGRQDIHPSASQFSGEVPERSNISLTSAITASS